MYDAEVLAITLNGQNLTDEELKKYQQQYEKELGIPVFMPLQEGVKGIVPLIQEITKRYED